MGHILSAALKYSVPVMLGYPVIGFAFGLIMSDAGYPLWLTAAMSVLMYTGAGQYIAVGLFAAGASLWEAALVQLIVGARHIAYGLSMINRMPFSGLRKVYCIFGLTDETFALLSSLPENKSEELNVSGIKNPIPACSIGSFMFLVTLFNQSYWVMGSLIGAAAGSLLPYNIEGISFALTALFIVLMLEQIIKIRKPGIFIVSGISAILCAVFLPSRFSLLAAIAFALAINSLLGRKKAYNEN